ncbi:hypothetical protein [Nostoc sp. DSM 114161]|uniref:hypothetical protein n=1 Tax=Nostoc sp. DSM 114161 TaxID=3440143 RepID=UPI0040463A9E
MAEPTLQQVFGANAIQTSTTLTITKADLLTLTASANNTAESLFTAILLTAKNYLSSANFDANTDQSVSISDGYLPSFAIRGENKYRQDDITVSLYKAAGSITIDADDY